MGLSLSDAARNAMCNALVDLFDVGGAGDLQIANSSGFGTILATLTLSNPAFGAASAGVATANAITADTNTAAGTATHFRFRNGSDVQVCYGTVNTVGADLNFNNVTFVSGGTCSISSFTITQPMA